MTTMTELGDTLNQLCAAYTRANLEYDPATPTPGFDPLFGSAPAELALAEITAVLPELAWTQAEPPAELAALVVGRIHLLLTQATRAALAVAGDPATAPSEQALAGRVLELLAQAQVQTFHP